MTKKNNKLCCDFRRVTTLKGDLSKLEHRTPENIIQLQWDSTMICLRQQWRAKSQYNRGGNSVRSVYPGFPTPNEVVDVVEVFKFLRWKNFALHTSKGCVEAVEMFFKKKRNVTLKSINHSSDACVKYNREKYSICFIFLHFETKEISTKENIVE